MIVCADKVDHPEHVTKVVTAKSLDQDESVADNVVVPGDSVEPRGVLAVAQREAQKRLLASSPLTRCTQCVMVTHQVPYRASGNAVTSFRLTQTSRRRTTR